MQTRASQRHGLARIEVLALALTSAFLLALVPVACRKVRHDHARQRCAANLAQIGRAMLTYANDYEGVLPRAGGLGTYWGPVCNWKASDRCSAFGMARRDGSGGYASISSCLYLLVKHAGMAPGSFVCPGDEGTTTFELSQVSDLPADFELTDAWDFGPEAYRHCSYAYHMPFGLFALTTAHHDPCMAVAADRNPWLRSPAAEGKTMDRFEPDIAPWNATAKQARKGNALNHAQDGQNVLFLDGHVAFEKRAYCGLDEDNIYTVSTAPGTGDPLGMAPPAVMFDPMNRHDSVLVHDPPPEEPKVAVVQPERMHTGDLQKTAVVATLDSPLPPHKNVIWCATFQMAWDKLKDDIIGEPILLSGAEEVADKLNNSAFLPSNLEGQSYYATAGFLGQGIIKAIQSEMDRRFPDEPRPAFDGWYRQLPASTIIAYAYLNVDVGFEHPFYVNNREFTFQDSQAIHTEVTSFRALNKSPSADVRPVREQVDVLCYRSGDTRRSAEFAVDLCKHTTPYQVVLARVPCGKTLRETLTKVEEGIATFAQHPDYEALRKLRPIDRLTIPDVLYSLTHDFEELLGKHLINPHWQSYFIAEARQKIDFALSRTGVILKSEARIALPPARRDEQINKPRHFYFDRPFLIYVRKRGANARPFFVMWVDNAELMQPYNAPARTDSSRP